MSYIDSLFIFALLYAILAWRSLPWALALLALALPSYLVRFSVGPLPSTALEAMILVVTFRWVQSLAKDRAWKARLAELRRTMFFWPGLVLLAASLLAAIFAADTRAGLGIWRAYFLEPFLLYLIATDVLRMKADRERLVNALGFSVLVLSVLAAWQYMTGSLLPTWEWTMAESRRATGPFTSPNALGLYMVPIAMLHLALLLNPVRARFQQVLSSVVVAAAALSIMLAFSRGAMVAFAVAAFFLLYRQWSKQKAVLIAVLMATALLLIPSTRQDIVRMATFQAASGQSRLALYQGSMTLLKQHPILGTGLAGFGVAFDSIRPESFTEKLIYPHNIFLNFWTETGILGLLAVLWLCALVVRIAFGKNDGDALLRDACIAALLAMLIHGLVDVPYFKNDLAVLTWMILAMIVCHSDRRPVLRT